LVPTSISENEIGDRNLKPVLTQGRKENEAYKRFMTQASPRQSISIAYFKLEECYLEECKHFLGDF